MKKLFYLFAFMLVTSISSIANAQIKRSSYQIRGNNLIQWTGPETEIDMASDERLSTIENIDAKAFIKNLNLTKVVFPKTLRSVGFGAFFSCFNLQEIVLPEGCTMLDVAAFGNCVRLTKIDLPSTIRILENGSLYTPEQSNLEKVYCRAATPPQNLYNAILKLQNTQSTLRLSRVTLLVPKAYLQVYKDKNSSAENPFKEVVAIEDENTGTAPQPQPEKTINLNLSVSPENSATFTAYYDNNEYNGNKLSIKVSPKKTVTIKSKAIDGYQFEKYTVNSSDYDTKGKEELTLDLSDYNDQTQINVIAVYKKVKPVEKEIKTSFNILGGEGNIKYTIKDSNPLDTHTGKSLSQNISVSKTIILEAIADKGYEFSVFLVDGQQIDASDIIKDGDNAKTEIVLSNYKDLDNLGIYVYFKEKEEKDENISITLEAQEGGLIAYQQASGSKSEYKKSFNKSFNLGEKITIFAKSEEGYKFDKFIVDSKDLDLRGAISIELPLEGYKGKKELKITAVFSKKTSIDDIRNTNKVFESNGYINIALDNTSAVKIYNISGNIVYQANVINTKVKVNKGIYIVRVADKSYKIMVQ